MSGRPTISVVTPFYAPDPRRPAVLAELGRYVESLRAQPGPLELVVAGTGPARRDPLAALLRELAGEDFPHAIRTLHHRFDPARQRPQTRAAALNEAVAAATGDLLLLLHADLQLPASAATSIRWAAARGCLAGAFPKAYDAASGLLRVQTWWLNQGDLPRRKTVGTNAVWLRRELWTPLPDWRLLEDFVLSDRLRRLIGPAQFAIAPEPVIVSAAKYSRTGPLASVAINFLVVTLFRLGLAHPDRLAEELYSRRHLALGTPAFWPSLLRQAARACRREA